MFTKPPFRLRLLILFLITLGSLSLHSTIRPCEEIFPDGFVFIKTPKTASTALKVFFLGIFKQFECHDWFLLCEKYCKDQPKIINSHNPNTTLKYNFIVNHIVNSKSLIESYMKSNNHLRFTSVRHPVDHVISSFFHFGLENLTRSNGENFLDASYATEKKEELIRLFSEYLKSFDNEQFRVIKGDNPLDEEYFIRQIFDFYDFIFVTERLEQDKQRFERKYGVVGTIPHRVVNTYSEHSRVLKQYLLSKDNGAFENDERWKWDVKLYNYVLKANQGLDFQANLTAEEILPPRVVRRRKREFSIEHLNPHSQSE